MGESLRLDRRGVGDAERIIASCYDDLRRIARSIIASDPLRAVFQPTELLNEALTRLLRAESVGIAGRGHMIAMAARTMRRVLIDEARRQSRAKRQIPQLVTQWPNPTSNEPVTVEQLDDALAALERFSPEHAQVVELRFTFGMTVEEAAVALGTSERTIKRRWHAARAWLQDHLGTDHD